MSFCGKIEKNLRLRTPEADSLLIVFLWIVSLMYKRCVQK